MASKQKNNFYAYQLPNGKKGIAASWAACEKMVKGVAGARYRGFVDRRGAEAWLEGGARYEAKPVYKLESGIYFDAGTGRGLGVEVNVTDEKGKGLLMNILTKRELTKFGTYRLSEDATNNYGELLGMKFALLIADEKKIKRVFGDSRLVIDYWSEWRVKRNALPKETVALAREVAAMRDVFEKEGGRVERISGGVNPADLGFH